MKRLLSLLCAFCLVAALFPFTLSASAASSDVINGFHLDADSVTVTDIVPNGWKFSESSTFSKKLGLTNVIESPWDAYGRNSPYILTFTLNSEKDFYFTLDCAASAHNLNVFIEIDGVKKLELSRSGSVDQNDCEKGSLDEALSAGSHTVKVQFSRSGDNNNNKAFLYNVYVCTVDHKTLEGKTVEATCTHGGYTEYACELCGYSLKSEETDPIDHEYVNGACVYCGDVEMQREEDGTYLIRYPAQLDNFSRIVNSTEPSAKAKLVNDIVYNTDVLDENGALREENKDSFSAFTPLGSGDNAFSGSFDGDGYTIYGLYIYSQADIDQNTAAAQYRAFVSMADGATVQNLTLSDAYICGTQFVAAFCANAQNGTVIRNCRVYDSYLAGTYSCAGICARAVGSTVRDCINASSVSVSVEGAGGILGQSGDHHVTVENCLNGGSVYAKAGIAGGIVGRTEYNVTIRNCLSVGALSGSELVGNILGKYYYTKFSVLNCAFKRGEHSALGGGSSPYEFTLSAGSYTEEELASGKVAYKLNADENDIHWYQTLGEDAYPLPDSSHKTVYPYGDDYTNTYCAHTTKKTVHVEASCSTEGYDAVVCEECGLVFEKTNIVPALGTHSYESGVCTVCGDGEVPAGEGTEESPYKIVNAGNLLWLSQYYNHTLKSGLVPDGKKTYAKMESDTRIIDMSTLGEHPFLPIGNAAERFSGVFDGNRNTLYNLKITEGETAGLFGETYDAQIKSLTIIGAAVSGSECAGTAVGYATGLNKFKTVLHNVRAWDCTVNGSRYVGGLVGRLSTGRMENCGTHKTRVNAAFYGGGLVGFSDDAVIANSYSLGASLNGTVAEGSAIGGLVGYNVGTVTDGYAYGATYSGASYSRGAVSGIGYSSKNCFYYVKDAEKFWDDGTSKTVSAFQSGEVCYLLNGGVTDGTQVWYEEIGTDNAPQLYYTGDTDVKCAVYRNRDEYSNTPAAWVEINASTVTAHNLAACGYADGATLTLAIDGAFYVSTIRDDSALALSSIGVNLAKETAVRALLWENLQKAKPIAEPYSTTVSP